MKKMELLSKILLSVWIVYNIFVMLVMPNVGAYFGRVTAAVVTPYASTVGLNAGWNFFSPEPTQPMVLKYTIHYPAGHKKPVSGSIQLDQQENIDLKEGSVASEETNEDVFARPDLTDDDSSDIEILQYPSDDNLEGVPNIIRKREWALMRYMILDPKRLRILMGPWLCKQHAGAETVEMEHIITFIPFLDQAVKFKNESVDEMTQKMKITKEEYNCSGGDEESLW